MVGCHISNYLITSKLSDNEVRLFGSKSPKWIDKNFLTRDLPDFKYVEGTPSKADILWSDCIVWVNDDYDDLDKSIERMKEITDLTKDTRKRNILVSSDLIYYYNTEPITEDGGRWNNQYKFMEDEVEKNQRWVILRPAQLYGDGIYSRIYEMCETAIAGMDIMVGDYKRTFCQIQNLVETVEECLTKTGINKEIFNIGDGQVVRYLSMANAICTVLGTMEKKGNRSVPVPIAKAILDDKKQEENIVISIEKFKKVFHDPNINNTLTGIHRYTLPLIIKLADDISDERKAELMERL